MAQLTFLNVVNKVLENSGLDTLSALTSLSGINKVVQNAVDDILVSLGTSNTWKPLEKPTGTITLATSTQTYAVPSDMHRFDRYSFIYDSRQKVEFVDQQELDDEVYDQDEAGGPPKYIWRSSTNWYVWKVPTSGINGKTIIFKYWIHPSRIDTSSPTTATWIPEPFDQSVLVNLATMKVMSYMGLPESQFYAQLVYGVNGSSMPGSLAEFIKAYRSPHLNRPIVSWSA